MEVGYNIAVSGIANTAIAVLVPDDFPELYKTVRFEHKTTVPRIAPCGPNYTSPNALKVALQIPLGLDVKSRT